MDVVPVVIGSGKRYFGAYAGTTLLSNPVDVVQGDRVAAPALPGGAARMMSM